MSTKLMPVQEAIDKLRQAGYFVEYSDGIVYARKRMNGLPDRLYTAKQGTDDCVSERSVKVLLNALLGEPASQMPS